MIGIIGYGMVGKAVEHGFPNCEVLVVDPQYTQLTIKQLCDADPEAIFVCVPTPTDDTDYAILKGVLDEITQYEYTGLTVVKSTILPHHLEGYDIVYNPEFLSRASANSDFINPPLVLIGGDRSAALIDIYKKYSIVKLNTVICTDVKTAALAKYTMNSFYALKVTYMNGIYDIAQDMGVNYDIITNILTFQPWMGTNHFAVPGPDGDRGFGGPCLPKDTKALAQAYDMPLLDLVLELNDKYRKVKDF
jgi:UDPglucose 6-dehydrogenase